jgi:large subunit ribosomal protein L3
MGMTRVFDGNNRHVPVTVLKIDGVKVVDVKTSARDGYVAVQLGAGVAKENKLSKPVRGHVKKAGFSPKVIHEFRVSDDCVLNVGDEILPSHFVKGQFVDISGRTIGKGFQGGMKRWNFRGLEASHGVSVSHRSLGGTGQRQDPGKVFKGKKMPGHMGDANITVQNLIVVETDDENGYILVKGAVPGAKGSVVFVHDAVKRALPGEAPVPAAVKPAGSKSEELPVKDAKAGDSPAEKKEVPEGAEPENVNPTPDVMDVVKE